MRRDIKVYQRPNGRWHVAMLDRRDLWHDETIFGYRAQRRAQRRAARLAKKLQREHERLTAVHADWKTEHERIDAIG